MQRVLGYMVAALGASAFSAGLFHMMTHACFKALLFLAAGSVIIGMHHEQDMRQMGGLRRYMPITYVCFLIGALSLCAIPPFSGFYSKDAIIEAVHASTIPGSTYAYVCVLSGSFVTALYTFRALFLTFHGEERMDPHTRAHLQESPWVVWLPLVLLAIPSVIQGALMVKPMLYSDKGWLGSSLLVLPQYDVMKILALEFKGWFEAILEAFSSLPFLFALSGIVVAWLSCVAYPKTRESVVKRFPWIYALLVRKYGFDDFNEQVLTRGTRALSTQLYRKVDSAVIDDFCINGSGKLVVRFAAIVRKLQTGYLYHYAFAMLFGVLALMMWQWFFAADQALLMTILSAGDL